MEKEIERTNRIIENGRELEMGLCFECDAVLHKVVDGLRVCLNVECLRYKIVVVK